MDGPIAVESDKPLTLQQAAQEVVPWLKGGAHRLRCWITEGVHRGNRRLWAVKLGGQWYTTPSAIRAFLDCDKKADVVQEPTLEERLLAANSGR